MKTLCLPISAFCKTGSGTTPSRNKYDRYFNGSIPWVKSGELRESIIAETEEKVTEEALAETSLKIAPKGAVLVAMYGANVGRVGILGINATTNQAVCYLIPEEDKADSRYIFHALQQKLPEFISRSVGGAQPNISQQIIRETKILLPPLEEQKRIAEILDQAEELRTKRRDAIAQLDTLTQSIFIEMFGDPVKNPKGWIKKPLSSLVKYGDTINYGVVQPGDDFDGGVPLIRVGDIVSEKVKLQSLKYIDPVIEASYKRSRLCGDEILISCVGTIGAVALADDSLKGFNIARAVARIPLATTINRLFVATYLRTDFVQRYFINELRTVSQPTLNIKQISETMIILPPLPLQQEFSQRVEAVEKLKAAHRASLSELDALFASLQHRAFKGDL